MPSRPNQLDFSFPEENKPPQITSEGRNENLSLQARDLIDKLKLAGLAARVDIVWNPRMRSSAGRATWPSALIELNPRLLEISASEVERTLRHELAHLVAFERARSTKIDAHGLEWQQACADLGIPGETATHRLPLPSRKLQRQWRYLCLACGKKIERVRRIKTRVACHDCCRIKNNGRYDSRFQLIERQIAQSPPQP